jgi:hypothetical protein
LCALTLEGSTSLASTFSGTPASPKGLTFSGKQVSCPAMMALPLIPVGHLLVIGQLQGFRMMGLGASAFTTRQVERLPAFRAEVVGVPFGGSALSADSRARGCQVATERGGGG